jgi:hypothetical protein
MGGLWRKCLWQGCQSQAYREVFTASSGTDHPCGASSYSQSKPNHGISGGIPARLSHFSILIVTVFLNNSSLLRTQLLCRRHSRIQTSTTGNETIRYWIHSCVPATEQAHTSVFTQRVSRITTVSLTTGLLQRRGDKYFSEKPRVTVHCQCTMLHLRCRYSVSARQVSW